MQFDGQFLHALNARLPGWFFTFCWELNWSLYASTYACETTRLWDHCVHAITCALEEWWKITWPQGHLRETMKKLHDWLPARILPLGRKPGSHVHGKLSMKCYVNKTLEGPRDTVELSFRLLCLITPLTVSSWYAEMLIKAEQLLQPGYSSPDLVQYRCIYTICYCRLQGNSRVYNRFRRGFFWPLRFSRIYISGLGSAWQQGWSV